MHHGETLMSVSVPLKDPKKIKSSTNRHRISTLLASMDISPRDRDLFYKHMGHSEKINQTIYQAPAVIMEVISVGKHVMNIDRGKPLRVYYSCFYYFTILLYNLIVIEGYT